jgi:hypothetical protein
MKTFRRDTQQQGLQPLEETVQQLRDESAILRGQKPRPKIAPSTLETPPKTATTPGDKRPGPDRHGCKHFNH